MFGNLFEGPHLIIIIIAVVILFGSKKVPEIMSGIGKGIRDFKKAMNGDTEEEKKK